jgi:hypothetical protein
MQRPSMHLAAAALLLSGSAVAQTLVPERLLPQPAEPGQVAPWQPSGTAVRDPGETASLHVAPSGPTLQDWYTRQGRPAVVLFFDRRLERVPAGWDGTARLTISREKTAGGQTETDHVVVGVEEKTKTRPLRSRSPVVKLVEQSLTQEMQRARIRMVDPTFAERAHAARAKGGDTEFDSLKGAAGYVLEVELAATGGSVSMLGGLKNVSSGEIVASVRMPVEQDLRDPAATDALARSFIKRLMAHPTGD